MNRKSQELIVCIVLFLSASFVWKLEAESLEQMYEKANTAKKNNDYITLAMLFEERHKIISGSEIDKIVGDGFYFSPGTTTIGPFWIKKGIGINICKWNNLNCHGSSWTLLWFCYYFGVNSLKMKLETLNFWDQSDILLEKRLSPDVSG